VTSQFGYCFSADACADFMSVPSTYLTLLTPLALTRFTIYFIYLLQLTGNNHFSIAYLRLVATFLFNIFRIFANVNINVTPSRGLNMIPIGKIVVRAIAFMQANFSISMLFLITE
jgi:hypothetical protein